MHYAPGNSQRLLFLFHKGLKNLLNLKFYKMQIELRVRTSQPLTAPPLIVDVQSCNLIFINAGCFDPSVAILCGAFPALYRRLAVTAIRNIAFHFHSSHPQQIAQHFKCCLALQELHTTCPLTWEDRGLKVCSRQHTESQEGVQTPACSTFL